jgi:hypothetical protein
MSFKCVEYKVIIKMISSGLPPKHRLDFAGTVLCKQLRTNQFIKLILKFRTSIISICLVNKTSAVKTASRNQYRFSHLTLYAPELNPIRHLLELAGARHFVHVSRIRVKH